MHNAYQHLKISAKHYSLIRRPQGSLELQLKVIKCVTKGHVGKDGEERVAVTSPQPAKAQECFGE